MITPGEVATIAAELAMPDLDLIKQGEQEVQGRRERFATGRTGNPAGRPRGWWSTPLSGAIEAGDFQRRLQHVEADHATHPGRPNRHEWCRPVLAYNPWEKSCCRLAADGGT